MVFNQGNRVARRSNWHVTHTIRDGTQVYDPHDHEFRHHSQAGRHIPEHCTYDPNIEEDNWARREKPLEITADK